MEQLWEILRRNPIILLVIGVWIMSAIGGAVARAQKRAERRGSPASRGGGGSEGRVSTPATRRPPVEERQSPEDIAAEIRRMMGLDSGGSPSPSAAPKPVYREVEIAEPEPVPEKRRTTLAEELAAKDAEAAARYHSSIEDRDLGDHSDWFESSDDHSTALAPSESASQHRRSARRATAARRLFDPRNPAAAIVAMEVLGPPRAMRPFDG